MEKSDSPKSIRVFCAFPTVTLLLAKTEVALNRERRLLDLGLLLISGSCLIFGSRLTRFELFGSRLIRFERGAAARAFLHAVQLRLTLPWGQGLQSVQFCFSLP